MSKRKEEEIEKIIKSLKAGNKISFRDNRISMQNGGSTTLRMIDDKPYLFGDYSSGQGWSDQQESEINEDTLRAGLGDVYLANLQDALVL